MPAVADVEHRRMRSMLLFFIGGAGIVWVVMTVLVTAMQVSGVAAFFETVVRVGGPPGLFALVMLGAGLALRPR
jgi:hypothetical protein